MVDSEIQLLKKPNSRVKAYGQDIRRISLINELLHSDTYDKGWHFGGGEPEFWKFSDKLAVPGGKVLDLGIGNGRTSLFFGLNGMDITGYETNDNAIAVTQGAMMAFDIKPTIKNEDLRTADLGDSEYDTVIMSHTFNHFETQAEAMNVMGKALKALKPGGHVFLRAIGIQHSGFEDFKDMASYPNSEFTQLNSQSISAPCGCSGEVKVEPHLFLNHAEIYASFVENGLTPVHTDIIPTRYVNNMMFGEDYNRQIGMPERGGWVTIIARKD